MEKEKSLYSSNEFLKFLWKNKWFIIIITAIGIIASVITSLVMTEFYLSSAEVFPTKTSTVSFSESRNAKEGAMDFGEEEEAEQLLRIVNSSRIRNRLVNEFNLFSRYDIEEDQPNKFYFLKKEYESRVNFSRTRDGTISIDVYDEDPDTAALIANRIVDLIDTVKNEMVKERTLVTYDVVKRKYETLTRDKNVLVDSIAKLSEMGVVSSTSRGGISEALGSAKNESDREFFKKQIEINKQYGALYDALCEERENKIEKLSDMEVVYEQAESDAFVNINHKMVVELATPADKKAKPIRWLIVVISTIATFFGSIFLLLVISKIREIREEL